MLKTLGRTEPSTRPGKGVVGVGGDSRARRDANKLDGSELGGDEVDGGEVEFDEVGKKKSSKND